MWSVPMQLTRSNTSHVEPWTRKKQPTVYWGQLTTITLGWSWWGGHSWPLEPMPSKVQSRLACCPTDSLKLRFVGGQPRENFFKRVVPVCYGGVTLQGQLSGVEMEINKSRIGQPAVETHQGNLKTFDIHQLFGATCGPLRQQVQFSTNYNLLCHSTFNDDDTTNTMQEQCETECNDELNIVVAPYYTKSWRRGVLKTWFAEERINQCDIVTFDNYAEAFAFVTVAKEDADHDFKTGPSFLRKGDAVATSAQIKSSHFSYCTVSFSNTNSIDV